MVSSNFSVSGKTAIVTGAGSGINFRFAEILLAKGCNVVIADLALRPEAEDLVKNYDGKSGKPRAVFVKTDVTSWDALSHALDATLDEFGDVDIVCPGAGIYEPHWTNFWHPPGSAASRDKIDGDHYALLDINLTHPIRFTQLAIAQWLHPRASPNKKFPAPKKASASNPKRVVHISSIAGQIPNFSTPLYVASKFGISGFVRSLEGLEATSHIRVNAVAPGVVKTPLWEEHPEKMLFLSKEQDAWVTPQEVAEAMLRLAEDDQYGAGTILEVGKDILRVVQTFNDPGPDTSAGKGHSASNAAKGAAEVSGWLADPSIWGSK